MDSGRWRAPAAHGPVRATLRLPGSKSITNRALILAALSDSPSVVRGVLKARDTALAVGALRALGGAVTEHGSDVSVHPGHPAPGTAVSVDSAVDYAGQAAGMQAGREASISGDPQSGLGGNRKALNS